MKMELEDVTGKPLLAIDVFAMSIKALKSHMLKVLDKEGNTIEPHEIKWVLTVPAIWDDSAKLFMRKSAEKVSRLQKFKISYNIHQCRLIFMNCLKIPNGLSGAVNRRMRDDNTMGKSKRRTNDL